MADVDQRTRTSPPEFGEQLRRTREAAGLQIEDIVVETKVSKSIFEALEAGRFQRLPERVFSRSFVAQYARTVGIDDGPLLEAFDSAWEEYAAESGVHPNLYVPGQDIRRSIRWRFWLPIAGGILILLVAAGVILRGSSSFRDELAPDPRRSGASLTADVVPTAPAIQPTPGSTPLPADPDAMAVDETVELVIVVKAGEECWIHYRDRDGMTGQNLLVDGQRLPLELAGPVMLTIGNAGAVEILIDDRVVDDLGLPGQVIHTEVTRDGFTALGSSEDLRS